VNTSFSDSAVTLTDCLQCTQYFWQ